MANPTTLRWQHNGLNTDGSPFTEEQFAGFLLTINDEPALSVPTAWNDDGEFSLPFAGIEALETTGTKVVRMAVTNRAGVVSDFSDPITFDLDYRKPSRPFGLQVLRQPSQS